MEQESAGGSNRADWRGRSFSFEQFRLVFVSPYLEVLLAGSLDWRGHPDVQEPAGPEFVKVEEFHDE